MNSVLGLALCMCMAIAAIDAASVFPFPIHASCKIDYTFGKPCSEVQANLVDQINKWKGDGNCPNHDNEKCLYAVVKNDVAGGFLQATHTTPVKAYVDTLNIRLTPNGSSCNVHAESSSNTWYAILDSSTNYCNLHNLITGSGLDKTPGYSEQTSDGMCTQYSSANCEKY